MGTLLWVMVGIIIGIMLGNAKMRKGLFNFLGNLGGKEKTSEQRNVIRRREEGEWEAKEDNYSVPIRCANCTFKGVAFVMRGQRKDEVINGIKCPDCGCKTIRG